MDPRQNPGYTGRVLRIANAQTLLTLALLVGRSAHAEEGAAAPSGTTSSADVGKAAFESAMQAYESGDKAGALRSLEDAYRLSHLPEHLYNIGRLQRELGFCREALGSYRAYLAASDGGPAAVDAAKEATALDRQCGHSDGRYWTAPRVAGWAAVGAGAAAGAGAVLFALSAHTAERDVESYVRDPSHASEPWDGSRGQQRDLDGRHAQVFAGALTGAAGALIVSGAVLLFTASAKKQEENHPQASVLTLPDGAALTLSGSF